MKGPEYLRHDNPYRNLRLSWASTLFPTSKFIVSLLIRTPVLLGTESSISFLILPIDRSHHCLVIPEGLTVIWFLMVTLGTSCRTVAQNPDRFLYNCPFPKSDFMPCLDYSVSWMWCTPHDSWKKWENSRKRTGHLLSTPLPNWWETGSSSKEQFHLTFERLETFRHLQYNI